MKDLIIIGAGAAGLFLAANLKKNALILEQNNAVAKKLLISGGGKCNVTNENINIKSYLCDDYDKLKQSLDEFSYQDNLNFFKGIKFNKIRNKQFFAPNSSLILDKLLSQNKSKIMLNTKVLGLEKANNSYKIITNKGEFLAKNVVIATGGISFATLGVSDIALKIAKEFQIGFSEFLPALVPLTLQKDEFFMKNLSGISIEVCINDIFKGSMLFTHKSISGPVVLSASLFWTKGKIKINFLNDFKIDFSSLKQASTHLSLPKAFIKEYLNANNLSDKAMNKYNLEEKEIINKLYNYEFAPAGNLGFNKAEVCKGGISLKSLNEHYESLENKGLFFIGECLNVAGILGGFNIHFAFASAKKLANYLNKELKDD
ncbi:aminoacetone oxidase family FAD-binding enzyme [Campylobacter sp. RM12642]|nr:aminoacetone oxidase family FAD-binding enzyme [Campylobacter sp. RM12642]MBZ8007282.1 aminoacetone oxidase family FAD-binding enzyme [Campylobacter sp. RM9334]